MAVASWHVSSTATENHIVQYFYIFQRWDRVPPLPHAIAYPLAVGYGHHLYVFAGMEDHGSVSRATLEFDTIWETWTPKTKMPESCEGGSAVLLNDKIYIVGGYESKCMCYDPARNNWATLAQPNIPHGFGAALAYQGKIILGGGACFEPAGPEEDRLLKVEKVQTRTSKLELYDPEKDEWTELSEPLPNALSHHYLLCIQAYKSKR